MQAFQIPFTGWGAYGLDILTGVDLTSDEMCQYICQWIQDALVIAVLWPSLQSFWDAPSVVANNEG